MAGSCAEVETLTSRKKGVVSMADVETPNCSAPGIALGEHMTAIKEFLKSHANKSVVAVTAGVSLAVLLSLGSLMVAGGSDAPEGAPGETGAPGPAGGTGPAGPAGETGSAGADMLGELSCTGSKVVINDNGWRCADPVLTRSFAGVMN